MSTCLFPVYKDDCLKARGYIGPKAAYTQLKSMSGQDFCDDVDKWKEWAEEYKRTWRAPKEIQEKIQRFFKESLNIDLPDNYHELGK
jgi:hypothetical protein